MRALLIVMLAACTDEVPANPTYHEDVAPILRARCVRCHGYPQISAVPRDFRLDMYLGRDVADLGKANMSGVFEQMGSIKNRTSGVDAGGGTYVTMPPRFPLTADQVDTIGRWVDQGGVRGARPGNHEPELAISFEANAFDYTLDDADGDLVTGVVIAKRGPSETPVLELSSGRGVGVRGIGFGPGTFELEARIDDGAGVIVQSLGEVTIP